MKQAVWAEIPERGTMWWMRLAIRALKLVGYWGGICFAGLAAIYFFITGTGSRRASLDYLRHLHRAQPQRIPRPTRWHAFLHHWHFSLNVVDRMWLWQGRLDLFEFIRKGRSHILELKGRGALLMGAHIGSFDALRAFSLDKGVTLNVVMYREHATKINALFQSLNPDSGVRIMQLDGSDFEEIFKLKDCVDRGELVAILADRAAPYGKKRQDSFEFLGKPAAFPQNPWILASLLECPVFMTVGLRTGWRRYHIILEPLAERVVLPRASRNQSLHAYMESYVRRLERLCCQFPYQWFNFYDFWKQDG